MHHELANLNSEVDEDEQEHPSEDPSGPELGPDPNVSPERTVTERDARPVIPASPHEEGDQGDGHVQAVICKSSFHQCLFRCLPLVIIAPYILFVNAKTILIFQCFKPFLKIRVMLMSQSM